MFIKKIYELRIRAEPEKAFFIAKISMYMKEKTNMNNTNTIKAIITAATGFLSSLLGILTYGCL